MEQGTGGAQDDGRGTCPGTLVVHLRRNGTFCTEHLDGRPCGDASEVDHRLMTTCAEFFGDDGCPTCDRVPVEPEASPVVESR